LYVNLKNSFFYSSFNEAKELHFHRMSYFAYIKFDYFVVQACCLYVDCLIWVTLDVEAMSARCGVMLIKTCGCSE